MSLPPPTREVRRLVQAIGDEAAFALVERRGGTRVYISNDVKASSLLADLVGLELARQLTQAYDPGELKVPLARRWRVLKYHQDGLSHPMIALRVGLTEDRVRRIVAEERAAAEGAPPPPPALEARRRGTRGRKARPRLLPGAQKDLFG